MNAGISIKETFRAAERESRYSRSTNTNLVVITGQNGAVGEQRVEQLVEALTIVHPGRIFVVCYDAALSDVQVGISARCNLVAKGHSLCSEIINIGLPAAAVEALPSLLRAHTLPGREVELLAFAPGATLALFPLLAPLADTLIFDSSAYGDHLRFLEELPGRFEQIIDMTWVGLGQWQDEVRGAFMLPALQQDLKDLAKIEVLGQIATGHPCFFGPFLLAGWLLDCLSAEVIGEAQQLFRCRRRRLAEFDLRIVNEEAAAGGDEREEWISSLRFVFGSGRELSLVNRNGFLDCNWNGEPLFRSHTVLESAGWPELLKYHFMVGEGFQRYQSSLNRALSLVIQQCCFAVPGRCHRPKAGQACGAT